MLDLMRTFEPSLYTLSLSFRTKNIFVLLSYTPLHMFGGHEDKNTWMDGRALR
jgi:hypothetical protein